jgi:hypothetical protein
MIVLRREQIEAFSGERERRFEEKALRHLLAFVPQRCAELGEAAVRESIRTAIRKSRAHGVESERDVLHYLNVMYWLGFEFESDPAYPWAREILENRSLGATTQLQWLVEEALAALEAKERDDVERR